MKMREIPQHEHIFDAIVKHNSTQRETKENTYNLPIHPILWYVLDFCQNIILLPPPQPFPKLSFPSAIRHYR
jgi:hypothetical protein